MRLGRKDRTRIERTRPTEVIRAGLHGFFLGRVRGSLLFYISFNHLAKIIFIS